MFFFPFATDAPLYHWPIVTVLLIVLNTAIYFASGGYSAEPGVNSRLAELLVLHFNHVNPLEWVTNNFMHADVVHLLGNMMFLWPFGLVVEGKLGWWKYLAVYLGIGAVYGAVMQLAMFASGTKEGAALGASAVLFGLLALCVVWAPKNELKVAYAFMLTLSVRCGVYDMSIMAFGGLYVAWQVVCFALAKFHVSSAALHLVGFAVGFPLGLAMLKLQWVDCEGWDLLSVWAGKHRVLPDVIEQRKNAEDVNRRAEALQLTELRDGRTAALDLMATHLAEGHANIAYAIYRKYAGPDGG
ncbi:MAG: rhomboid family intramembrane serine protease, partial [Planctomycetia bacterium]|nr:rhomboid family intramembrane serine protease [Planctomycetia bacterium]